MPKDKRVILTNYKVVGSNGTVFHFDGKHDPVTGQLRVYRMHGDVNKMGEFNDAIYDLTQELGRAAGLDR